jgi:hypothetical protein
MCSRSCGFDEVVSVVTMLIRILWMLTIHSDWLTHQHRDTLASIVGHPTLTSYLAIADGESIGRVKFEMTEVCNHFSTMTALLICPTLAADATTLRSPSTQR